MAKPTAFLLPAEEATQLWQYLMTLPMKDVRVHVQRIENLKPLFENEDEESPTPQEQS